MVLSIAWIFFDVGSTLVDESLAYDHRAREMLENSGISFSEFDAKRIELSKRGLDGNSAAIEYFGLKKTPWHSEDEVAFSDAFDTLEGLRARGYRMGIIANQVVGTAERLENFGLLKYFDVIAASAELGVAKPDRAIFQKALESAKCQPQCAVMVGDRLDNDIIPAKALGMRTVWIRRGLAKYNPVEPVSNVADWIIDTLSDLNKIFI